MCLVEMVQLYEVEQEVSSVSSVQFIIRGSSAYLLDKKMFSHILILLAFFRDKVERIILPRPGYAQVTNS